MNISNHKPNSLITRSSSILLSVLDYVVVFLIIITRGCMWAYDTNLSITVDGIISWLYKALALYCVLALVFRAKLYLSQQKLLYLFCVLAGLVAFSYFNPYRKEDFLYTFIIPIVLMFFWYLWHKNPTAIWKKYTDVVLGIACVTFVFYLFGSIIPILPEHNTTDRLWGVWKPDVIKNFYYMYYESQYISINGLKVWRNCSFFTEAPKYNFILCTALWSELFLTKKIRLWAVTVLIFMIISTFCTMGLILLVVAAVFYVFLKFKDTKLGKKYLPYAKYVVIAGTVLVAACFVIKFLVDDSISIRMDHIQACMKTFWDHKLFGAGWYNEQEVLTHAKYVQGVAIGIPLVLAMGGIFLSLVILIPFSINIIDGLRKGIYNSVFFVLLFLAHYFLTIIPMTLMAMIVYVIVVKNDELKLN